MKLIVISKSQTIYSLRRLLEASKLIRIPIEIQPPNSLSIKEDDIVLIRNTGIDYSDQDLDYLIASKAQKIINSLETHRILRDKWLQYDFLVNNNLPVVKSYPLSLGVFEKLVLKTKRGNGGRGVWVLGADALKARVQELLLGSDHDYFLQEKIDIKKEYKGFYCFGDFYFFEKIGGGNLKDGLSLVQLNKTPEIVINCLNKLKTLLDFELISMDFAEDLWGDLHLFEVNSCPGFETVEEALGVDIASKILTNLHALR